MDQLAGVYNFEHPGGAFEVHLRPGGKFHAPKFQTKSAWLLHGETLQIDFGKFGKYELAPTAPGAFAGGAVGAPDNWRKMQLVRSFHEAELKLFGSVWNFQHPGGEFEVEFHADAYNHFVCQQFPAHSHWSLNGDVVDIDWGKFGKYELKLDTSGESMAGSAKGAPDNWRKAQRIRALSAGATSGHEHSH